MPTKLAVKLAVMSPAMSQVLSQVLSPDEEKNASIDAKDATSSSKVATLADNGRNKFANRDKNYIGNPNDRQKDFNSYITLLIQGCKSEEKGIKVIVFYRKDDFPSLFREKLANFVRVINYNKVQLI